MSTARDAGNTVPVMRAGATKFLRLEERLGSILTNILQPRRMVDQDRPAEQKKGYSRNITRVLVARDWTVLLRAPRFPAKIGAGTWFIKIRGSSSCGTGSHSIGR